MKLKIVKKGKKNMKLKIDHFQIMGRGWIGANHPKFETIVQVQKVSQYFLYFGGNRANKEPVFVGISLPVEFFFIVHAQS